MAIINCVVCNCTKYTCLISFWKVICLRYDKVESSNVLSHPLFVDPFSLPLMQSYIRIIASCIGERRSR